MFFVKFTGSIFVCVVHEICFAYAKKKKKVVIKYCLHVVN